MLRPPLRTALSLATAVLLATGLAACSLGDGPGGRGPGNRRVEPPVELRQPSPLPSPVASPGPGATPAAPTREGPLTSAELGRAYRAIYDRFVDKLDHKQLIRAAREGLRAALEQEAVLPLATLPLDLQPPLSDNLDKDWASFAAAYDGVSLTLPSWTASARPDWIVLRSMLESLNDGHSVFLTPDDVRRRNETSYGGVGIRLARPVEGQAPLVAEVFSRSPAAAAGVKAGVRILAVDGQELVGKPLADVVQLIRGPTGSEVTLRLGGAQQREVTLKRAQVQIDQVEAYPPQNGVGYVRIRSFNDQTAAAVRQFLTRQRQLGARGLVLDLRGNPGGSLEEVGSVAGAFVQDKPIGFEVNRVGQRDEIPAVGEPLVAGMPVSILVDGDTASGAEILAAALREYNVAELVGTSTAGNVGVAAILPLPDGSAMQITEQRFVTPSGTQLDGVGVKPDVLVELGDADLEAGRDPQLQRAAELVAQKLRGSAG